jgi:hypothetical protein
MRKQRQPVIVDTDGALYPDDATIRAAAWTTILSGGHFSYLDESLVVGPKAGQQYQDERESMRQQLSYLCRFVDQIDVTRLEAASNTVFDPLAITMMSRSEPDGHELVAYLASEHKTKLDLSALPMPIEVHWYNPRDGQWRKPHILHDPDIAVEVPDAQDWVVRVRQVSQEF